LTITVITGRAVQAPNRNHAQPFRLEHPVHWLSPLGGV
jgi:hypothetical protein